MQKESFIARYKLHHIIFWMGVACLWYYLRYQDYDTNTMALQVTLLKVTDLALMVYITNYLLIPRLLYKKKYGWFALAFMMMIMISSISKMYWIGHLMHRQDIFSISGTDLKGRIYDNVIPHFFLVIAGAAVKLMMDYRNAQVRLGEMAKEKAEAELNFLKSQINPHFVFNSLNSVYFLIDKNNAEAREALHQFSDMLRYQLYEMNGDTITVEKEIAYLKDFVDLQKLRKDEHYAVNFQCGPGVSGFMIEPLLLIPFVENAFKHISHHKDQMNYINLQLERSNGEFSFMIENSSDLYEKSNGNSGGIGLSNVKRRLELLYPGQHTLAITRDQNKFRIDLKLRNLKIGLS